MWTLLELALIADVASSASATAQNTALASAPEYVKEAHFIAQSLYREKINAPRPIRETLTHDAVLPVALVVIIALIALGYTALGIIMILGWALMALMARANKVSRNSEFEEKA
jgi:hypothetical protein